MTTQFPSNNAETGRILGGRYQLTSRIASGGMGEVFRAKRLHIGDEVAVKVLRAEFVNDVASRGRFQREAQAAASLRHPSAVVIHDFGEEPDGTAYLVMELLAGRNLRQVLTEEGTFQLPRLLAMLRPLCEALDEGHQQGIIHRDLKPENIVLLPPAGNDTVERVKLLDFGIAKLANPEAGTRDDPTVADALTKIGTVVGTPQYMSPEQCQGEAVDARSDVYSLGVLLYELLTGQVPFNANSPTGIAIKQVTETPVSPRELRPDLPATIAQIILRALAKAPHERQPSAYLLAQEFQIAVDASRTTNAGWEPDSKLLPRDHERPSQMLTSALPVETGSTSEGAETLSGDFMAPATQMLGAAKDTQPQPRSLTAPAVADTDKLKPLAVTEAKAKAVPLAAAPIRETAAQAAQSELIAPVDNSLTALVQRLKKQPILLGLLLGLPLILLGVAGYRAWTQRVQHEPEQTAPVVNVPSPVASATPTATPAAEAEMAFIPGGALTMHYCCSECPPAVVIVKPFYLDRNEVTNAEYELYVRANNAVPPANWPNGAYAEGADKLPVVGLSWADATNYAQWAGKRLPTETEWEFAARGNNEWKFPWGNEWQAELANVQAAALKPVGSFAGGANSLGVFDLIGNAQEWTASDFVPCVKSEVSERAPAQGLAGQASAGRKVVRGGSYLSNATKQPGTVGRAAMTAEGGKYVDVGFRCARDVQ